MLWRCYSRSYKGIEAPDRQAWIKGREKMTPSQIQDELRREISKEKIINDRIGYLLFDATTLPSEQAPPFFYFIHDPDGWKITTHLDSLFHRELEKAIERNEFKLPED